PGGRTQEARRRLRQMAPPIGDGDRQALGLAERPDQVLPRLVHRLLPVPSQNLTHAGTVVVSPGITKLARVDEVWRTDSLLGTCAAIVQCGVSVAASSSTGASSDTAGAVVVVSSHSIGSGLRVIARASTSSIRETGTMSRPLLMVSLISTRSLAFSSGMSTVLMPPRKAASSFSLRPAIGHTRPRSVISPVMATSRRTGMPVITETIAVTMAT